MATKAYGNHPLLVPKTDIAVVIDDDPICRTITKHTLDGAGIRTFTAKDWAAGQPLVEYLRPRIILVDGLLPQYDGSRICKALRGRFAKNEVLLVLMTAFINVFRGESNIREGSAADLFIQKPFTPTSLLKRIQEKFPITDPPAEMLRLEARKYMPTEATISQLMKQFDRAVRNRLAQREKSDELQVFSIIPAELQNPDEALVRRTLQEICIAMAENKNKGEHVWHPDGKSSTTSAATLNSPSN